MAAVEEGRHPLPHLLDDGRHVDRQEFVVVHQDAAVHDRRADIRRAGAVDEGGGEVVDGLRVWAAESTRMMSARRPGARLLIDSSRPTARALCSVAWCSACSDGSRRGSPVVDSPEDL
jgi:hypothetical protein